MTETNHTILANEVAVKLKENPSEKMQDYLDSLEALRQITDQCITPELGANEIVKECIDEINSKGMIDTKAYIPTAEGDISIAEASHFDEDFLRESVIDINGHQISSEEMFNAFEEITNNISDKLMNDNEYKVAAKYAESLMDNDPAYSELARQIGS